MRYLIPVSLALVGCTLDTPVVIDDPGDMPIGDRYKPLADTIEAERIQLGAPGVSVLVMEHGQITFAHGFGKKNPDAAGAVDANTLFRIGSVTKMLTATALLQRVADGSTTLDTPIGSIVPGLASAGAGAITVRHLLTHSSGLDDFSLGEIDPTDQTDAQLSTYALGGYTQAAYQMAPEGRMWNYSNPNFSLAGLAIEKLDGLPYRRALDERVFAPLGMSRTVWHGDAVIADGNYAMGLTKRYDDAGTRLVQSPDAYDTPFGRPAGFAWSSVYDLARFVDFLRDGNAAVLRDAERAAMQSPQIDMKIAKDFESYGYALFIDKGRFLEDGFHATPVVSHGGDIYGFAADVYFVPATGFAFIALANTDDAHFGNSLAVAMERYADLPAASAAPDLAIDPSTWPSLAGTYQDDNNVGRVIVTATTTGVTVSMPDLDAAGVPYTPALEPIDPDNFLLSIQGEQDGITFLRDGAGKGEYIRDRFFVARRGGSSARQEPIGPHVVRPGHIEPSNRRRAVDRGR